MKYKIMGIVGLICVFCCMIMISSMDSDNANNRIHQHLTSRQPDAGCDCDGTELCTHLPLVIIDTGGQEIPGKSTNQTDAFGEEIYTTAADGSEFINVEVSVIDNEDKNNHPSDMPDFTTSSQLRVRGHASRRFEKSPYLMKFINENGEENDISVMGMASHNEWILNGPYLDKSLIRNYMWYNISGEIMEWAPNVRFCELILDGEYRGLYLMTESIANGKDGRLQLKADTKNSDITGYLLRIDRPTEEDIDATRDIYSFAERMGRLNDDIALRYPGKNTLTEDAAKYIELDFAAFEKALYSYDYDTDDYGYWNWIDVNNYVDYYLINEFSRNMDAGRYSTYIYKEVGGKYKMCVWDFNNACDNFPIDIVNPDGFVMSNRPYYFMLFKDEAFVNRVISRYEELRKTYLSDEYLMDYIDETLEYLGPAAERNNTRWREAMTEWEPLQPAERNLHSQEEAVTQLKEWLLKRGKWMDENIDSLQAVAHPSRNKRYNH